PPATDRAKIRRVQAHQAKEICKSDVVSHLRAEPCRLRTGMRILALAAILCFALNTHVASPQTAFGKFAWWRIIDGAGTDMASAVAVDSQNSLYVAGVTASGDLPTT